MACFLPDRDCSISRDDDMTEGGVLLFRKKYGDKAVLQAEEEAVGMLDRVLCLRLDFLTSPHAREIERGWRSVGSWIAACSLPRLMTLGRYVSFASLSLSTSCV